MISIEFYPEALSLCHSKAGYRMVDGLMVYEGRNEAKDNANEVVDNMEVGMDDVHGGLDEVVFLTVVSQQH